MSKSILLLLICSAIFGNEEAHGAKILCAPTLEVEQLALKADEQGLLRGVSPTSRLILSDVEISTKPTPAVLPLASFSDRRPRWVKGSLKQDDYNKLHLHCHYHYGVVATTVPLDARSCKLKLNYTGLWVSNMGALTCQPQ